jgi:hypothetical protein
MSLRGALLLFATKQSPCKLEIASGGKTSALAMTPYPNRTALQRSQSSRVQSNANGFAVIF